MSSLDRNRLDSLTEFPQPPPKRSKTSGAGGKAPKQPDLRTKLHGLNVEQLADLLANLIESGAVPGGEAVVRSMIPSPDVGASLKRLENSNKMVSKAMPRYGSGNEYSYNRCKSACSALRQQFSEEVKAMENAAHWESCLRFCKGALRVLEDVMRWDKKSHNKWINSTRKSISRLAVRAAKAIVTDPGVGIEQLKDMRREYERILNYYDEDENKHVDDNSIEAVFDAAIYKADGLAFA